MCQTWFQQLDNEGLGELYRELQLDHEDLGELYREVLFLIFFFF